MDCGIFCRGLLDLFASMVAGMWGTAAWVFEGLYVVVIGCLYVGGFGWVRLG